ncbi:YbaB/EbfC family nucleoid-associated protein [Streptomyces winkii]|uniref:YbaB/EbfC family nucleoid-associated protein n=1 Tax=Streptomyces winkii TaxID=3051178 RepID=UPI0028D11FD6|nr:YbaB/EbfC family nucleoid-associated protein [Streptomyces sp. DSM 40971]
MPDDARDHIDDIRDRADVDAQVLEQLKNAGPSQGSDDTGSVTVDLDTEGKLAGIRVDPDWHRSLRDTELGSAVLSAYQQAVTQRLEAWGQAVERAEADPPRPRPRPGMSETVAGQLFERFEQAGATIDDTRALNRLLDMLDELDGAMEEAGAEADAMSGTEVTGRSSSGHVTATVSGAGDPVGLDFDTRWLGRAHAFNIGREAAEALEEARRRLAQRTEESPPFARLTTLAALAENPSDLVTYLGLNDSPPFPGPAR